MCGSKKVRRTPRLERHRVRASPRRPGGDRFGIGRVMVIRAEESVQALDLARAVSPHQTGRGLCHRRPQRGNVSKAVGTHPGGLPRRPLFHRLLGGVCQRDPGRAARGRR